MSVAALLGLGADPQTYRNFKNTSASRLPNTTKNYYKSGISAYDLM